MGWDYWGFTRESHSYLNTPENVNRWKGILFADMQEDVDKRLIALSKMDVNDVMINNPSSSKSQSTWSQIKSKFEDMKSVGRVIPFIFAEALFANPMPSNESVSGYTAAMKTHLAMGMNEMLGTNPVSVMLDTETFLWDSVNAVRDVFGHSSPDSAQRNALRREAIDHWINEFKISDGPGRVGMLSEFVPGVVGAVVSGAGVSGFFARLGGASRIGMFGQQVEVKSSTSLLRIGPKSAALNQGVAPITEDLVDAMSRKGRLIDVAVKGSDDYRYLESIGAEGSVNTGVPNHILIKEDASKSALLEEFLHGTQVKLGIVNRMTEQEAEIHVKDFMIRHASMLGLDNSIDFKLLEQLRTEEIERFDFMYRKG